MITPYIYFDNRETLPNWFIKILKFIPESQTVFVLTNSTKSTKIANKKNIKFIKLLELDYQHEYVKFTKIYKHLSTHTESFELACFERYFALNAFMSKFQYVSAWQLDTDVVPTISLDKYSEIELIFSTPYKDLLAVSAHTAKFSQVGIQSLVNYLLNNFYQDNFKELENFYVERITKGLLGGVTDMTAVGYWLRTLKSGSWYNSFGIEYLGMRINHVFGNLEHDLSLASNGYTKSLFLIHLKPSVVILKTPNKTLHYANMHFQGHYKNLIPILIDLKFLIGNSKVFLSLTKVLAKIKITINI
jgi:hypothetical protein